MSKSVSNPKVTFKSKPKQSSRILTSRENLILMEEKEREKREKMNRKHLRKGSKKRREEKNVNRKQLRKGSKKKKWKPNKRKNTHCLNPVGYQVWYFKDAEFLFYNMHDNVGRERSLSFKARDDCSFLFDECQFEFSGTFMFPSAPCTLK